MEIALKDENHFSYLTTKLLGHFTEISIQINDHEKQTVNFQKSSL